MPFFLNEEHEYDEQQLSDLTAHLDPYFNHNIPNDDNPSYPSFSFDEYRTPHGSPCSLSSSSTLSDDHSEMSVGTPDSSTTFHFNDDGADIEFDFGVDLGGPSNGEDRSASIYPSSASFNFPTPPLDPQLHQSHFDIPDQNQTPFIDYSIPSKSPYGSDVSPPQYGMIHGGLGLDLAPTPQRFPQDDSLDPAPVFGCQDAVPPVQSPVGFPSLSALGLNQALSSMFAAFCREHAGDFGLSYVPQEMSNASSASAASSSTPIPVYRPDYKCTCCGGIKSPINENIEDHPPSLPEPILSTPLEPIVPTPDVPSLIKSHKRHSTPKLEEDGDGEEDLDEGFESDQIRKERRRIQNRNAQRTYRAKQNSMSRFSKKTTSRTRK